MSNEEQPTFVASFELATTETIGATFTIAPNIQDLNYVHYQDTPSATWNIAHNLGKYPSVTVVTSAGDTVFADVNYTDSNNITVEFNGAFAGKAFLN